MTIAHGRRNRGLLDGPLKPIPGRGIFYFRVTVRCADGVTRSFDCAVTSHTTLTGARDALAQIYAGANIYALNETEFDTDGLPKAHARSHWRGNA